MGTARRSAIGLVDAGTVSFVRGDSMSESLRRRDRSALRNLDADRRGAVLDHLLAHHPELREEAEVQARQLLDSTHANTIAAEVEDTFLRQPFTVVGARAGRQPGGGYVHEADAGWELLEEALEPFLEEIRRRGRAGLHDEAAMYADGVAEGLAVLASSAGQDCLIGWGALEDNLDMLSDAVRREREASSGLRSDQRAGTSEI